MYRITAKWPGGRTGETEVEEDAVEAFTDFLYAAGADDVKTICVCGECETCYDRAAWGRDIQ